MCGKYYLKKSEYSKRCPTHLPDGKVKSIHNNNRPAGINHSLINYNICSYGYGMTISDTDDIGIKIRDKGSGDPAYIIRRTLPCGRGIPVAGRYAPEIISG